MKLNQLFYCTRVAAPFMARLASRSWQSLSGVFVIQPSKSKLFSVFLTDPPQLSLLVWILMSFILSSICSFQGAVLTVLPVIRYQELPDLGSLAKAFLMFRQPPALPCRLQHSTIGRLGLNHRVRDGNGCDPQAHRHRKDSVIGSSVSFCRQNYVPH